MQVPEKLRNIIKPAVEGLGYELVGIEFQGGTGNGLLRIYVDQADGISLGDCQAVSEQVSAVLDVEDPIAGRYTLEVSSPGLDRPLFEPQHFQRFSGHAVRIRLAAPLEGRRKWSGLLKGIENEWVVVEVEGEDVRLPLDAIEQARLVPEF